MADLTNPTDPNSAVTLPVLTPLPTSARPTMLGPDADRPPESVFSAGDMIEDRYKVVSVHGGPGISGMGVVYIVETEGRRYAAKTFQHQFGRNLSLIERFLREARTWIYIGFHPNIVHAYYIDIINATPYLFMEYVPTSPNGAISLADRIRDGRLTLPSALDLAIQCCEGMVHAAESVPGLVHRDLKPENLLIAPDDTLKITDFGLVRCHLAKPISDSPSDLNAASSKELTQVGAAFGTPAYMAPEQFVEAATVSQAADIYAFGCCFYEAISGRRLFTIRATTPIEHLIAMRRVHQSETPVPLIDHLADCPQELDHTIMQCLEKDPSERWGSFEELRDRLQFVLDQVLGKKYTPRPVVDPTPRQVAEQSRSLTLLDGYHRAVRLKRLRESQDFSPYSFHLALASYFLCAEESDEELRQLEKAIRVSGSAEGYEAVRRLGELLVKNGELDSAERIIDEFLAAHPGDLDQCLEPYVYLRVAQGDIAAAEKVLEPYGVSRRTNTLRAYVWRAAQKWEKLATLLKDSTSAILAGIVTELGDIEPGARVGWEFDGDVVVLRKVVQELAPNIDLSPLDDAVHVAWPDLDAYPDFSSRMAWLSEAVGGLSEIEGAISAEEKERYATLAELLDYPTRLRRHLTRDEVWFWMSEPSDDSEG